MSAITRKLSDITLQSVTGDLVRLRTLWAHGPLVLAFIRHFG